MGLAAFVVDRRPYGLRDIGFGREQRRFGHARQDRRGVAGIGFGQHILKPDVGVLRKGGRRAIAGLDELHRDAERRQLVREAAGEALDRTLASRIGGGERERREGRRGGDIDDRARPAFAHLRDHRLRHRDRAERVGRIDRADLRHRRMFERAEQADAGIVDEHVDRPRRGDRGGDAGVVGDVEGEEAESFGRCKRCRGGGAHGGNDGPAAGVEMAGSFKAIARRAAGDEDGFHGVGSFRVAMKSL